MRVNNIVINASPLILLCNSELSFILPAMFQEIVIPDAVWNEIILSSHSDKASQMVPDFDWLKKISVDVVPEIVRWDLGDGETEVLSFAFTHRNYVPMFDDQIAKKCALSFDIPTLGTGSVLILAKEQGIIDSVGNALLTLRDAGMWISDAMIALLKEKAHE